ncbi:hypothetical protein GG344DRAFT_71349 [Lentinula edodes]|nr:hypothetical protein GG344DRAFT_71349 [Lentinula edodes]
MDKILKILASSLNTEEYCISVKEPLAFSHKALEEVYWRWQGCHEPIPHSLVPYLDLSVIIWDQSSRFPAPLVTPPLPLRDKGRDEIDVKIRADEDEKEVISDAVEGKSIEKYNKEKENKEKHDKRDKKEAKDNGGEEKEYELSNSNGKDEGSS